MNHPARAFGHCTRCEQIPEKPGEIGRLYIWFPLGHVVAKVFPAIKESHLKYQLQEDGRCLVLVLEKADLQFLIQLFATSLSPLEMEDTRALFISENREPRWQEFSQVTSLQQLIRLSESGWLLEMLAAKRVTSHFQPIVYTQDTAHIFGHEALLRGIDHQGALVSPGGLFNLAKETGLLFQLDLIARKNAIQEATRHGIREHLFINFCPTAIYDPATCLRMTVRAIDEAQIPHENIVFEVIESDQPQDCAHLKSILQFYQEAGFLVALDDFGAGYSNLNLIHELRPDFIKLDMQLLRNVHLDPYKALITKKILEITHSLNIRTIAEGIESAEELAWVQKHGATFVQGYFIGKPSEIPVKWLQKVAVGS